MLEKQICESFISERRQCVTTRGCATESECTSNGVVYDGQHIQVGGQYPAGMQITATCCDAHDFPDDDAVAIDYNDICNSAPSFRSQFTTTWSMVMITIASISLLLVNYW
eukprot:scaffold1962_cov180-Ochromonas_danica.AAC.8